MKKWNNLQRVVLMLAGAGVTLVSNSSYSADFVDLAVGNRIICGLERDGTVECTAPATSIDRATPPADLPALVDIEAGNSDVCGIDRTGVVHCWGLTLAGRYEAPADMIGYESLSVGTNHWCGVTTTRNIHCAGNNSFGESSPPEPFTAYNQVLARWQSTCGRRADNSVHCWGDAGPNRNSMTPFAGPLVYMMPQENTSCGIDTADRIVCNNATIPGLEGRFRRMVADFPSICGVRYDGTLACVLDPSRDISAFRDVVVQGARLDDVPAGGNYQSIDGRYTNLTCALSYNGDIDCWGSDVEDIRIPGTVGVLEVPGNVQIQTYGRNTIELIWDAEVREFYEAPTIRAYEVWRDGVLLATTEGRSYFDDSLSPGVDYNYQVRALGFDDSSFSSLTAMVHVNTAPELSADSGEVLDTSAPPVVGNTIQFNSSGWFQVLESDTFVEVCQGGSTCRVSVGSYLIINHTTGQRWENVVVGAGDSDSSPGMPEDVQGPVTSVSAVTVVGSTIQWPNDGWYQVQSSTDYSTVCEGVRSCTVPAGTYTVINHSSGTRWDSIVVSEDSEINSTPGTPRVVGSTIQWDSSDWYQVQDATDYTSICEGGMSCSVAPGSYNVINLNTGERWLVEI